MKKRCIGFLLACMLFVGLFPMSNASAATLSAAPNLNISYSESVPVTAGTIRYVSQLASSGYFCHSYWDPYADAAIYECYTADISMALSSLGLDATPATLGTYWTERGHTGGTPFTTVAWDVGAFGANCLERSFEKSMAAFVSDPGVYSPPIIHLTTYSERGHYVTIAGQVDATHFLVVDPASDSVWTLEIENNVVTYPRKGEMRTEELEPATQFKRVGSVTYTAPTQPSTPSVPTQPSEPSQPVATPTPTPTPKPDKHNDGTACISAAFTDVKGEGNWAHAGIDFCVKQGLMQGTDSTHFSPDKEMTRAMLVTVLYRAAGSPDVSGQPVPFTDLKQNWYRDAVAWAYHMGVTAGVSNEKFAPDKKVTREQLVVMLYRFRQLTTATPAKINALDSFSDACKISSWAAEPMRWAVTNGLLTGVKADLLKPGGTATRAQLATILMRFMSI